MVQRLAAVVVLVWDHTEACRVRLENSLPDERTDPVEAPVGPNTKRANESQEPTPTATSSSPGPAALMPTKLSERADGSTDGVGTTRTENAKERGQTRRQQVKSLEDQW